MKFAIFGDIHANLEALEAVLADARRNDCTDYVCLGDIVGYNANPHECCQIIRDLDCPVVKGNHDDQASMPDDVYGFNPLAEAALAWTRNQITDDEKHWLRGLQFTRRVYDFTIVHATLDAPQRWGYVLNQIDAAKSFLYQRTPLCFHGHTHTPRAYVRDSTVRSVTFRELRIEPEKKYFLNVGSVGQPRDGDWHASYAIFYVDRQIVELRRVEYDIDRAQKKIVEAGLPQRLADRLAVGK